MPAAGLGGSAAHPATPRAGTNSAGAPRAPSIAPGPCHHGGKRPANCSRQGCASRRKVCATSTGIGRPGGVCRPAGRSCHFASRTRDARGVRNKHYRALRSASTDARDRARHQPRSISPGALRGIPAEGVAGDAKHGSGSGEGFPPHDNRHSFLAATKPVADFSESGKGSGISDRTRTLLDCFTILANISSLHPRDWRRLYVLLRERRQQTPVACFTQRAREVPLHPGKCKQTGRTLSSPVGVQAIVLSTESALPF